MGLRCVGCDARPLIQPIFISHMYVCVYNVSKQWQEMCLWFQKCSTGSFFFFSDSGHFVCICAKRINVSASLAGWLTS